VFAESTLARGQNLMADLSPKKRASISALLSIARHQQEKFPRFIKWVKPPLQELLGSLRKQGH